MMNPEVKKKWVEALRSSHYQKAMGKLRNDEGFCCLGVLCDLAAKEGIGRWAGDVFLDPSGGHTEQSLESAEDVKKWAGIDPEDGGVELPRIGIELVVCNDGNVKFGGKMNPLSFAEIADLIEAHL